MNDAVILLDRKRAKAVQPRRVGCKVKVNRHNRLAFQLFWNKNRSWEGTELLDTPENRKFLEAKAVLIGREIKKGTFDYLKWFPEGNRADLFQPKEEPLKTIGEYFRMWILRKTPPVEDVDVFKLRQDVDPEVVAVIALKPAEV